MNLTRSLSLGLSLLVAGGALVMSSYAVADDNDHPPRSEHRAPPRYDHSSRSDHRAPSWHYQQPHHDRHQFHNRDGRRDQQPDLKQNH